MSRWFRHYSGMMRDEKLVRVAVKSSQPVERVIWIWGALLESASEVNDGGHYDFDADEAAYFLRCDGSDIRGILNGLEDSGRIHEGVIVRWSDRQFDSDSSRERQRRYREKRKSNVNDTSALRDGDDDRPSPNVTVTGQDYRLQKDSSSTLGDQVPRKDESKEKSESRDQASPLAANLPTDPSTIYGEAELKGFAFEFDGVDVSQAIHELAHWTNKRGITDLIERKNAIYGGLKKRHAALKLHDAMKAPSPSPQVSPQLAASRLTKRSDDAGEAPKFLVRPQPSRQPERKTG